MPRTSLLEGRSKNRHRLSVTPVRVPLIPLQEQAQPLIPLQVSSPRARLQHELSYAKPTSSHQIGTTPPTPTKAATESLQKRQASATSTVTDAAVVVIDGNGHTIVVTGITNVPTGPIPITLPFTTITVEPLASITGILTMAPVAASAAVPLSSSLSASEQSTRNSSTITTSSTASATALSTLLAPTQTGNNQLGQPNTPTSTNSSTTTSPTATPNTLATIASSALITDVSSSSSTSTTSSMSASDSSITVATSPTTSTPTTSGAPAAATTTAVASTGGATVNVPVVAGVVGGLAGLAVIAGLLLLLFKFLRKRQSGSQMLQSMDDEGTAPGTSHSNAPMTQNFASAGPAGTGAGAAAAGAAGGVGIGAMIKRMTGGSTATTDTAPSERGFQNLGGRKLESVLISGGDGFREPAASGDQPNSFSRGWAERFPYETPSRHSSMIVGPSTPFRRPSSSIVELSASRPDSETIRPMNSPPRNAAADPGWPLSNTSSGRPMRAPEMAESSTPRQMFRGVPSLDPIGRTRYSQDGSRNSRFTEGL